MRALARDKMARQAQRIVGDDPRLDDVLAEQKSETLILHRLIVPPHAHVWESYYSEWARIEPVEYGNYRLSHMALTGQWQELDVVGSLEDCLLAILRNQYHLFFG